MGNWTMKDREMRGKNAIPGLMPERRRLEVLAACAGRARNQNSSGVIVGRSTSVPS